MRAISVITLAVGAVILSGCPCGLEEVGELIPLSGPFGYHVTGPWDFQGSLTKEYPGDPEWILQGTFMFPTSGYCVLRPQVTIAESFPEQVHVQILVLTPPPGQPVLQVLTPGSVSVSIPASDGAVFDIRFAPACLGPR